MPVEKLPVFCMENKDVLMLDDLTLLGLYTFIIFTAYNGHAMSNTQLARHFNISMKELYKLLDKLIKKGLIEQRGYDF
jgi:DNA-binding MarR family transcriptional regulator